MGEAEARGRYRERSVGEVTAKPSFRDGLKDRTRNLEIPGSMLGIAPE